MNSFQLKMIAVIGMTLDHIAVVFADWLPYELRLFMYFSGGITFPIMAYLFLEGYRKTSNRISYSKRLLFFAILSIIPFYWAIQIPQLPVLFVFLLSMLCIALYEKRTNRFLFLLYFLGINILSAFCDWGVIGVCLIMAFWMMKSSGKKGIVYPLLLNAGFMVFVSLISLTSEPQLAFLTLAFSLGNVASIPLLLSYNGERGKPLKYFFYLYYPGHLLLLALLSL